VAQNPAGTALGKIKLTVQGTWVTHACVFRVVHNDEY
jgi:hypothetical protein